MFDSKLSWVEEAFILPFDILGFICLFLDLPNTGLEPQVVKYIS